MMRGIGRTGLLVLAAAVFGSTGCSVNMMAIPYFLTGREPMDPPRVNLLGKKSKGTKKILVLGYADSGLRFGFDALDQEITGLVIGNIARTEDRFDVIPERKVREWQDRNPNWADTEIEEIGVHFDVDYVIFLEVQGFSLNETKNQFLLKGTTKILVKIFDVNKRTTIFTDLYARDYPPHRAVPLTDLASEEQFRRMFLSAIAKELSWYVVPHRTGESIE